MRASSNGQHAGIKGANMQMGLSCKRGTAARRKALSLLCGLLGALCMLCACSAAPPPEMAQTHNAAPSPTQPPSEPAVQATPEPLPAREWVIPFRQKDGSYLLLGKDGELIAPPEHIGWVEFLYEPGAPEHRGEAPGFLVLATGNGAAQYLLNQRTGDLYGPYNRINGQIYQGNVLAQRENRGGLLNLEDGRWAALPDRGPAQEISEGKILCERDGNLYCMDMQGNLLYEKKNMQVGSGYDNGICIARIPKGGDRAVGEYVLLDGAGNIVPTQVQPIHIAWRNGRYIGFTVFTPQQDIYTGLLDTAGQLIIPAEYEEIGVYGDYAVATSGTLGTVFHLPDGEKTPHTFDGRFAFTYLGGDRFLVNSQNSIISLSSGKTVALDWEPDTYYAQMLNDQLFSIHAFEANKVILYNEQMEILREVSAKDVYPLQNGYILCVYWREQEDYRPGSDMALLSPRGEMVLDNCTSIQPLDTRHLWVTKGSVSGIVDLEGNWLYRKASYADDMLED